jgi:hypothetical protein
MKPPSSLKIAKANDCLWNYLHSTFAISAEPAQLDQIVRLAMDLIAEELKWQQSMRRYEIETAKNFS